MARVVLFWCAVAGWVHCGKSREQTRPSPLAVFYAGSLESAVERWSALFRQREGIAVRSEASGSQDAARKISELGRAADLLLVADYQIIDWLLVPDHAQWQILFAGNEVVVAHSEQSRYAGELTADTWRDILLRPDVRVGRCDENLAPIGYQTLLVGMLSDIEAGVATTDTARSMFVRLRDQIPPPLIRPDVSKLIPLLGMQADYVFLFRNMAHQHNVKYLRLPPEINLSDPAHAKRYARASVTIRKSTRGTESERITVRGGPILYGLTIPRSAPNPEAAARFVELILSNEGRAVLEDLGFTILRPAIGRGIEAMPPSLRAHVSEWHDNSAN
ncbi:MAG: extracellular solute-binding protein [Candidatus Sumerlaeia bacterium]|nr:extracellular solute-binding protein [Candidatus Sumerlaeia bacterium]